MVAIVMMEQVSDWFRPETTYIHPWTKAVKRGVEATLNVATDGLKEALFVNQESSCPSFCPEGGHLDKAFKDLYISLNGNEEFFGFETECSCDLVEDDNYRRRKNQFKGLVYGGTLLMVIIGGVFWALLTRPRGAELPLWVSLASVIRTKFKAVRLLRSNVNVNKFLMWERETGGWAYVVCLRKHCSRDSRRKFLPQIRALRRLKHPHIVALLDWFRVGCRYGIALELAPFGNLDTAISTRQDSYTLQEKRSIYRQMIEAVAWMHTLSWVHLNIRAASVLVFEKWSCIKLSGFSHALEWSETTTLCTKYDLHPHCCCPQVQTKTPYSPYQADIWALKALFLHISTGHVISPGHIGSDASALDRCSDWESDLTYSEKLYKILAEFLSNDRSYVSAVID